MATMLVTGGCGFIGSSLVNRLVQDSSNKVIVIDDLSTGNLEYTNYRKDNLWQIDICSDLASIPDLKCDVIFHIAAKARIQPSFLNPKGFLETNCLGTVNVLELARKNNSKVVYAGSSSAYGNPHLNPYSHSKFIGELHHALYREAYGLNVAIARFYNVYGKNHCRVPPNSSLLGNFERQTMNKEPLTIYGTGEKRRDFTHVEDIVEGLIRISQLEKDDDWNCNIFNLGRGHNYSVLEVANMFGGEKLFLEDKKGEVLTTLADLSFTKEKLNWEPSCNLPDYVEGFLKNNE